MLVFLQVPALPQKAEAAGRRLLRLLLLWGCAMPAHSGGAGKWQRFYVLHVAVETHIVHDAYETAV
jgi:hypothetical protein